MENWQWCLFVCFFSFWKHVCKFMFSRWNVTAMVEGLSAVVLIVLFLLQKFGTSRVSFLFSPIMGAWTLFTPLVGIYSIVKYYPSIFKAISPHYIYEFFGEMERKGGCYSVALSFVSQVWLFILINNIIHIKDALDNKDWFWLFVEITGKYYDP